MTQPMTEADILQLERNVLETTRRLQEEKIRSYRPFDYDGGQLDFHRSQATTRMVVSTNRGGKTWADAAEVDWWARGVHPYRKTPKPPVRIRVCCTDFKNVMAKLWIPLLREFVIKEELKGGSWEAGFSKEFQVLTYKNKSTVELMSYKQAVEDFGGTSRQLVVEDEPAPEDIHHENEARVADVGGEFIVTLTPVNLRACHGWIKDLFESIAKKTYPNSESFFFDIYKNPTIKAQYIKEFEQKLKNRPEEFIARLKGKFPQFLGIVYKQFNQEKHVIQPFDVFNGNYSLYVAIDPHPREVNGIVFLAADAEGNVYIFDEILENGTAKILVDKIRAKLKGQQAICIMDNSAGNPNQFFDGGTIQYEFLDPDRDGSKRGIAAMLVDAGRKKVHAGIRLVEDYLGLDEVYQKPKLFIFANCVQTIHQFETYMWDDYARKQDKGLLENPRKKDDHLMDCIRYVLTFHPQHFATRFVDPSEKLQYDVTGAVVD